MIRFAVRNRFRRFIIPLAGFIAFLAAALGGGLFAAAQTPTDGWSTPVNLSQSGASSNPVMVIDSSQVIHILWEDKFAGFVTVQSIGSQWTKPEASNFPFDQMGSPRLVADNQGNIYAFWLNPANRGLFFSRVAASDFGKGGSWGEAQRLGDEVVDFDVTVDAQGVLHVIYVRSKDTSPDLPAGVYYLSSRSGSGTWTAPKVLYQSPYFRGLSANQANIQISSATQNNDTWMYVAWDNQPRERVYLDISRDGGSTWDDPVEVDKPDATSGTVQPFNIRVSAQGNQALLVWQVGEPGVSCIQNYRSSSDRGATWSDTQRMLPDLAGCPQGNQFITGAGDFILLLTTFQDQMYLLAWNGSQWSDPQEQRSLNTFVDPDTFNNVNFRCRQAQLVGGHDLMVVGCDIGSGGDIWLTSRSVGTVQDWFPPPSSWQVPVVVATSSDGIFSPALVADAQGRIHAFWSQQDVLPTGAAPSGGPPTPSPAAIHYAQWDGQQLSQPGVILSSPVGDVEQLSVAAGPTGKLYAVWRDSNTGEIDFSWADGARAMNALEWVKPKPLPSPKNFGTYPAILADSSGTIDVAYAIPLNEDRGIYLVQSSDGGDTWSQPIRVFDAVAAGWEMIDQPHLARSAEGVLHMIWGRYSLPGGSGSLGLYYAHSVDGGKTWTGPELVLENPVSWSQIIATGTQTVLRAWQENNAGHRELWGQSSQDGGLTWSRPEALQTLGETSVAASLTVDTAGQIHLLRASVDEKGEMVLSSWAWDGQGWNADESLDLGPASTNEIQSIQAAASPLGQLGVIYAGDSNGVGQATKLYFTWQNSNIQGVSVTPLPSLTPTPPAELAPTSTPVPTATPTLIFPKGNQNSPSGSSHGTSFDLAVGLLPAGLIVLGVLAGFVWMRRRG